MVFEQPSGCLPRHAVPDGALLVATPFDRHLQTAPTRASTFLLRRAQFLCRLTGMVVLGRKRRENGQIKGIATGFKWALSTRLYNESE